MDDRLPWLPYSAVRFLDLLVQSDWSVFEWGSGDGTQWLSERCASVASVEHDPDWLRDYPPNVTVHFIQPESGEIGPDPSEPSHYRSGSTTLGPGRNWQKYVQKIDEFGLFDLVLVDGWARSSCIAHATPHVKPGGWLVVDNTGDRPWYLAKTRHLFGDWDGGWERATFFGRGPNLSYLWECSFFGRPVGR